jgi:short-subunit dehydrogenase
MRRYGTVLVTGASRGLGAALARELLARDYRVVLAARDVSKAQDLVAGLPQRVGERAACVALDLSRPADLPQFARDAQQPLGAIDVLINNAGIGSYKPLTEWTAEEIIDCVGINLLAPMLLARELLPGFISRKRGMIVNVASDLARRPLANMAPYVATKFGLLGFSGSLLREAKQHGVKVTSVLPGIIDTGFGGAREGEKEETWALRPAMLASRIVDLLELPEHVVIDEMTIHPMQQQDF